MNRTSSRLKLSLKSSVFVLLFIQFLLPALAISQRVTVNFDAAPAGASASKATLKYNKNFAYSITFDDATRDQYTVAFPLFKGGLMDDGINYPGLYYTDGCGHNIPFKAGLAWNSVNASNTDIHTGNIPFITTWAELDQMLAAGWDVFNHSNSHRARALDPNMTTADYLFEVQQNEINIRNNTASHLTTTQFVVPSGDSMYYTPARTSGYKATYDQLYLLAGNGGLNLNNPINVNNFYLFRENFDNSTNNQSKIDNVANLSNTGQHYWYNEFTHVLNSPAGTSSGGTLFSNFKNWMQYIENTYGKNGSDKVWVASLQEVYEYAALRDAVNITSSTTGNQMVININVAALPANMRRKSLTLIINSNTSFSSVTGDGANIVSYNGTGTQKIINIDLTGTSTTPNPPIVTLTRPASDTILPNSTTTIMATATGTSAIQKVSFYSNNGLVSEITNPPYQFNLVNIPLGNYWIKAIATDITGLISLPDSFRLVVANAVVPTFSALDMSDNNFKIRLRPNTAVNTFYIDINQSQTIANLSQPMGITITNLTGGQVLTQQLNAATHATTLDVSALPNNAHYNLTLSIGGVYYYRSFVK
jgi:Bacterial Ig domain